MIRVILSRSWLSSISDDKFDAWKKWVAMNVTRAVGLTVHIVSQHDFSDRNLVSGATLEQSHAITHWLSNAGWEAFCAGAAAPCSVCLGRGWILDPSDGDREKPDPDCEGDGSIQATHFKKQEATDDAL